MSRRRFNQLIGLKSTPVAALFAHGGDSGWVDDVDHGAFPLLSALLAESTPPIIDNDIIREEKLRTAWFGLPRCLDDFGFREWLTADYDKRYVEMARQWCSDRRVILKEQSDIYERCWNGFDTRRGCHLYFLTSNLSGEHRVIYIGKQFSSGPGGMRKRLVDHTKYNPGIKTNNYIGGCLQPPNTGKSYLSIRVKCAELRRRGLCQVNWIDLSKQLTQQVGSAGYTQLQQAIKTIEAYYIQRKWDLIRSDTRNDLPPDPVNL